jgi:DNA-binding beta-propeller fold protein YncE
VKPMPKLVIGATLIVLVAATAAPDQQAPTAPIFEVDPLWPKPLPNHWLLGPATGLAVDARDHVYVVHINNNCGTGMQQGVNCAFTTRTETGATENPPIGECCLPAPNVLHFDPAGTLVGHWGGPGQGYNWPVVNHGIGIDNKGNIWIGGSGGSDSQILKFSPDGKLVAQVGKFTPPAAPVATQPAATTAGDTASAGRGGRGGRGGGGATTSPPLPANSGSTESFGGPADFSFDAAANEAFVADGYRNRRVAVVDLNTGAIKRSIGAFGNQPNDASALPTQQFGTPVKCAELARDGLLYVCDRANNRVQVFRKNGTFVKEQVIAPTTRGAGSVWDVTFSRDPQQRYLYVADGANQKVWILDRQSLNVLTSFGTGGRQPGQFYAVTSIATDSKGNIYTVEGAQGKRLQKFVFKGVGPVKSQNAGVVWPRSGEPR